MCQGELASGRITQKRKTTHGHGQQCGNDGEEGLGGSGRWYTEDKW